MTRGQKAILLAGALLVFGIGLLWRLTDPGMARPPPPRKEQNSAPLSAIPKASGVGSAIPRKSVTFAPAEDRPVSEIDPYSDWPLEKILDQFMVPPGRFDAGHLGEAFAALNVIYGRHGDGRQLGFTFAAGWAPDQPIAFDHGNISFRSLLDIVAALGGARASIDGDGITFSALSDPGANASAEVLVGSDTGSIRTVPDDPFAAGSMSVFAPARYFQERYGVELPPDLTIQRDPDDPTSWTIEGPSQAVALIEALIAAEMPGVAPQAMITQNLIRTPPGVELDPHSMTDPEFQQLIRDVRQTEGVELLSTPSLVTLPGQGAQVEIAREVVFPTELDDSGQPSGFEVANVGLSIPISAVFAGLDRVQLSGATEFTTVGDQSPTQVLGGNGVEPDVPAHPAPDSVHVHATDFDGHLIDGDTALIEVARDPDGHAIYQFLTTRRITPPRSPPHER